MRCSLRAALIVLAFSAAGTVEARPFEPASSQAPGWQSELFEDAAANPSDKRCDCSDPVLRTQRSCCFPQLFLHDTALLFTAPARWNEGDWQLVTVGVLGVAGLVGVDDELRTAVQRSSPGFQDDIAKTFEPFGTWASLVVIGGFYFGGLAAHDSKARGVAADATIASILSGVIITPALKWISGRSRPRENQGPYDFKPFTNGPAFPSGHATQAFTVASVIATEYPSRWVQVACYVPASLVLYARMRHDGHWASDVVAGALVGWGVGSQVAKFNLPVRMGPEPVRISPLVAPKTYGLLFNVRLPRKRARN